MLVLQVFFTVYKLHGQQLTFSPAFPVSQLTSDFSLIGSMNNKIYMLSSSLYSEPQLLLYDTNMQMLRQMPAGLLRGAEPLLFSNQKNCTEVLTESYLQNIYVYQELKINDTGAVQTKNIISLPANHKDNWAFISSPGRQYGLLYKVEQPANDSISISCIVFDSVLNIKKMETLDIAFSAEFDRLNSLYIDDTGNTWFIVHDQPLNYKLVSKLRIYCLKPELEQPLYRELFFKEKKPSDVLLQFDRRSNTVSFYSLYTDFYTHDVAGILSFTLKSELDELRPVKVFEFDTETKKDFQRLTTGITRNDLLNYLRLFNVSSPKSPVFFVTATLNYAAYKLETDSGNRKKTEPSTRQLTEQNPLRMTYQKDLLIRQLSGTERRRGRGRLRDGTPASSNPGVMAEAMRLRPDLFFLQDNAPSSGIQQVAQQTRRIYDKHIFFSFDTSLQLKGYQWYKKEFFHKSDLNSFAFYENGDEFISFRYDHNKKDKLVLLATIINNSNAERREIAVDLPSNISLELYAPVTQTGPHSFVFIYNDRQENKKGLAKISW